MDQKLCPGCEEPVIDKLPGCPLQCGTAQCKAYPKKPVFDFEIMPIVWILGGPGSGKVEQSKRISSKFGLTHLCVGQMLRDEMARGTERTRCFNSVMGRGGLVPNDVVLALLKEAIQKGAANGARGFVLDGFPREKSQGPSFERFVGQATLILYLDATVDTLFTRMRDRKQAPGRVDETPDAMKLRLETYMKHYDSIYELYKYRLVKINANGTSEQISGQIAGVMDGFMKQVDALKAKKAREARQAEQVKQAEQAKREAYVMPARKLPERKPSPLGSATKSGTPSNPGTPAQSGSPSKPGTPAQPGSPSKPGSPTKKPPAAAKTK